MSLSNEIFMKNNAKLVEDWGCGNCVFKEYLDNTIRYIGIDGSDTGYQDKIEDLTKYRSDVDSIYIRHIIEHNDDYKHILENSLESFNNVMILVLFTPFTNKDEKEILTTCKLKNYTIPDISFNKNHLINIIESKNCTCNIIENIESNTIYGYENIFVIKHKSI